MELQAADIRNTVGTNPGGREISDPYTLIETLDDLQAKGFTCHFNLTASGLEAHDANGVSLSLGPDDFNIVELFRFEGISNPSDTSVLYAIESTNGLKGTLVSSCGVYADAMSAEMIKKLDTRSSASSYPEKQDN